MLTRSQKIFVGDFETTVYKGQTTTLVWASACVQLHTEDVKIFHSIGEQFNFFKQQKSNLICYYHNLKFDGTFWLSYFINELKLKQALVKTGESEFDVEFLSNKEMENDTFKYSISDLGQWYSITVKVGGKIIEFRDSLKLLPFSVKKIGKSFNTKHKKLDMKYVGLRYPGCEITDKEKEYIANDVLVVKEALEIMFEEGHSKLTIGSCCLTEYKKIIGKEDYSTFFPNLYEIPLNKEEYGSDTVGAYIHNSYRGGWCYLVKGKENKIYKNGTTADVNSLYPSVMSSESGSYYPVGTPKFWKGNFIPKFLLDNNNCYYFIRIKTRFYIKKGYLPFIQLKRNPLYKGTEMLFNSDVKDKDGNEHRFIRDMDGKIIPTLVTMTMTMTDYNLFRKHYNVEEFEILDGCYFSTEIGLFDRYMEKYKKIKMESKGARRELAKLFLNNLYGKMAASPDSSYKVVFAKEDGSLSFFPVHEEKKIPGYIPVGSAITSYARAFTITAAQKNYHGVTKPGFIYADTDSIHCDLPPDEIVGVPEDPVKFCHWKYESCWDKALFVRQKTYAEHITHENRIPIDKPEWNIKCAGMPETSKELFLVSISDMTTEERKNYVTKNELSEAAERFVMEKRKITDFKLGLVVPGKLMPKRIPGGTLLVETTYEMR